MNLCIKHWSLIFVICLIQEITNGQNIINFKEQLIKTEYEENASPEVFKKMLIYVDTTFKGVRLNFETGFNKDSIQVFLNDSLVFSKSISTDESAGFSDLISCPFKNDNDNILIIINNKKYIHHLINKKYYFIKILKEPEFWIFKYTNNVSSYE